VDGEVDGFEEDGVLGVVVLDVLGSFARVVHDGGEDGVDGLLDGGVVWRRGGKDKVNESTERRCGRNEKTNLWEGSTGEVEGA